MFCSDRTKGIQSNWKAIAGRKGAGKEGYLKHALRKICQPIGSTEWQKFVKAINNRDEIEHMYGSTTDRINIHDFKLEGDPTDRKEYRLTYTTRKNKPGGSLVTSVRTLLSKIRKENNL